MILTFRRQMQSGIEGLQDEPIAMVEMGSRCRPLVLRFVPDVGSAHGNHPAWPEGDWANGLDRIVREPHTYQ